MEKETFEEKTHAEVEAWQQCCHAWLRLTGAGSATDRLRAWNAGVLDDMQKAMEPAWRIPQGWLEGMTHIVEAGQTPQGAESLALQSLKAGRQSIEITQRNSARWFQAVSGLCSNGEPLQREWMESAVASRQAWQQAVHHTLALCSDLFLSVVESVPEYAAGQGQGSDDQNARARGSRSEAKGSAGAKAGQPRATREGRNTGPAKTQTATSS